MSEQVLTRCPKHAVYFYYQCTYCLMDKTVNAKPRAAQPTPSQPTGGDR